MDTIVHLRTLNPACAAAVRRVDMVETCPSPGLGVCVLLVMQRPPVLPRLGETQRHFLRGCSALLFRDNDKALNPSVDLTSVLSSIFKLPCGSK